MYCFTESLLSRRVLRPNFFTSIYVLFSNKIMFLLSKVVRTNLFIQYCLTFSRNSHKCIYRKESESSFILLDWLLLLYTPLPFLLGLSFFVRRCLRLLYFTLRSWLVSQARPHGNDFFSIHSSLS